MRRSQQTPEERILEFLREHPENAFTAMEILEHVDRVKQSTAGMAVLLHKLGGEEGMPTIPTLDALARLIREHKVIRAELEGREYFHLPEET